MNDSPRPPLPPLEKSVRVPWGVDRAFRRFTDEIGLWWPRRMHSVGQRDSESVSMEGRVGGRIVERIRGASDATWGTITAWEPPHRVAFTWHPGRPPEEAQEIEVRFAPDGEGTRLLLVHRGWEKFGAMASRARRGYNIGWGYVLAFWADRKSSLLVRFVEALTWTLRPFLERAARANAKGGSR